VVKENVYKFYRVVKRKLEKNRQPPVVISEGSQSLPKMQDRRQKKSTDYINEHRLKDKKIDS
jgi:hypothetical protein